MIRRTRVPATVLPGRTPPDQFAGRQVLPNMTVWAFEPNPYVGMQSPAAGIRLWSFWGSRPVVQRVRLEKKWNFRELNQSADREQERSEEELKANAIN